jgi:hypothetical protein
MRWFIGGFIWVTTVTPLVFVAIINVFVHVAGSSTQGTPARVPNMG